ncbi:MAG: SHOCT domain-containing protein [Aeromicrobium sp.]
MMSTDLFASDHWDGPGPWWPFIPLFWIAFFLLVLFLLGVVGRRRHGWRRGSFAGESRLAERYAAGEIDETEYRQRLAVLREKDR